MKVLLDTHILLWWLGDGGPLSVKEHAFLNDPNRELFYSAASVHEIAIKWGQGRLKGFVRKDFERGLRSNAVHGLPVRQEHAWELLSLPDIHRDPFDRLLIAQARVEGMQLMTHDERIRRYALSIVTV